MSKVPRLLEKETQQCKKLRELIDKLKTMIKNNSVLLEIIYNSELLIKILNELDSLIEMCDIKELIVRQIYTIIILAFKRKKEGQKYENIFDNQMLHLVFMGPPGTGKSLISKIVAKIYYAIGIINQIKNQQEEQTNTGKISIKTNYNYDLADNVSSNLASTLLKLNNLDSIISTTNSQELVKFKDDLEKDLNMTMNMCQPISNEKTIEKSEIIVEPPENYYVLCGRSELVAEYLGQTSIKCRNFLTQNLGKIIIIEEAYSLFTDDRDSFGMEALTEINRFMDEYANRLIIFFNGYKNNLEKTIFRAQPGLKRRCSTFFTIGGYSYIGLTEMFKLKIKERKWKLDDSIDLMKFFREKYRDFKHFGGDIDIFIEKCKLVYSEKYFDILCNSNENMDFIINKEIIDLAFEEFKNSKMISSKEKSPPWGLYI